MLTLVVVGTLVLGCTSGTDEDPDEDANPGDAAEAGSGLRFAGPEDGAVLGADAVANLAFTATGPEEELRDVVFLHDDEPVEHEVEEQDRLAYAPDDLEDGEHRVVAVRGSADQMQSASSEEGGDDDSGGDGPEVLHEWAFTVDTVPPDLEVTAPDGVVVANEPLLVAGVTEPGATVTVNGTDITVDDDGAFEHDAGEPQDTSLTVVATDAAGNTTQVDLDLAVVPSRVTVDELRTVHVSFWGWAAGSLREPIIEMVEDGLINAVQLDIKDEAGEIGYDSQVPLAQEIGAAQDIFDLDAAVAELHDLGVPVVGRIVAFADPILAQWAWENDERDWVIQTDDGEMYVGRYAGFSNFAHEDIRDYNIAVAEEAAAAGVDHILWDYIRRPDGDLDGMEIVGLDTTPEEAIVEFARLADERLAPYGVEHGASVYGIAATRAHEIAQDIPGLADHLDYVAPMVYPSHWGPGEYRVDDPIRQPYDIVFRSLEGFVEATDGKRARVVPWLEDTRFRAWDRPHQVREQIRATYDLGINEWLLWDPHVVYTPDAFLQPGDHDPDESSDDEDEPDESSDDEGQPDDEVDD